MGLWHVFYADWQMECCGTPFGVGDEVSWPLLLSESGLILGGGWHDQLTKVVGPVEGGVLRDENGLEVAVPQRSGERVRLVGLLTVETHGAELPEVRGRVRALQVLTQGYVQPPDSDTWWPVPEERWLRAVDRCPKWFAESATGKRSRRSDAGTVVTLDVPDTDSWLSYAVRKASGLPEDAPPGAETEGIDAHSAAALLETFSTVRGRPT
ncbi:MULTISPECIES: DUF6578 domain-containing protein [unclassified Streptomyces]|uniref:DUF6578 domain-containing protein n=1 Tax=unclassified Streptomyces TaxID=2593676 RepID=UPI00225809A9|nr:MULTISPECIES: DUF6578 domain-containing protein [unclassified Streptomyces]MCX5334605.1 hypothetical protein [Streptomyces sp. NBC_00140]MCX5364099.1 hypothetical protein [Streptomyces sp. NBC_00124]